MVKQTLRLWSILTALTLIPASTTADANEWQSLSSGIPGQVGIVAIAISPTCPNIIYMSTNSPGGLYFSSDGGSEWENIAHGLSDVGVTSLAVHPTQPFVVYVGTVNGLYGVVEATQIDQSCPGSWSFQWERISTLSASHIYTILIVPSPSQRIVVGSEEGLFLSENNRDWCQISNVTCPVLSLARRANGDLYAGTAGQGLIVSEDDGQTWCSIHAPLVQSTVLSVRATPGNKVYCWANNRLLVSDFDAETQAQPANSDSANTRWHQIDLPDNWEPFSFAAGDDCGQSVDQRAAPHLYIGSRGKGILVSHNFNSSAPTWRHVADTLTNADITCLEVHPTEPNIAFAGTKLHGLYRTADGGANWQLVSKEVGLPAVLALAQHPARPSELFAGTVGGLYKTSDAGQNWRPLTDQLGKLIVQGVAVDPVHPKRLYIATHIGIFASNDDGKSWDWLTEKLGRIHTFNVTATPVPLNNTTLLYAGSWGNNLLRSLDSGQTWSPIHNGLETLSVHAFAQHPARPDILFVGTVEGIYKSKNGGASWAPVSRGMREGITTFALAIDSHYPQRIYAGTTAGVYRSENEGEEWTLITGEKLASTINVLAIHPGSPASLYAGTEHSGLYVSTDFGEHWSFYAFPETSIYTILIDKAGFIWLGTEKGVLRKRLIL